MSSILKALRKLEHEKSEIGEGSVDLARDILKRSYEDRRTNYSWLFAAIIAALLLLTGGWWLLAPESTSLPPNNKLTQQLEAVTPDLPVISDTVSQPSQPSISMPNRPLVQGRDEQAEVRQQKPPLVVDEKTTNPRAVDTAPLIIPDLIIEEIVFVTDPSARLAVINDLPVMQGTDIEGARVIEILSDRVRFEFKGIRFDKFKAAGN